MAELVDANDMMFTPFEPKLANRFILELDGIPAYMIKEAARPKITGEAVEIKHMNVSRFVAGKYAWDPMDLKLYDPIVPSAAQAVMEWVRLHHESVTGRDGYSDFYKKDITINVLGPVGDKVEEWTLKGAFVTAADFGTLSFDSAALTEVTVSVQYDYAILQF